MEGNAQRRRSGSGQTSTPSSLRNCLYPPSPAATAESGGKSLRHSSKSKSLSLPGAARLRHLSLAEKIHIETNLIDLPADKSEPPRPPPAFNRVKGKINMETPTKMGSGADLYLRCNGERSVDLSTEVPWLQDTSPTNRTPRTPLRSRSREFRPVVTGCDDGTKESRMLI